MNERVAIRVGNAVAEAAPDLWGLFIEDLNDALDGGLNAERVRNGDFEFAATDRDGFHPLTGWAAEGAVQVLTDLPIHPNNRHYASLTGPAAITNEGWDGMRTVSGERLRLSLFARAHGTPVELAAAIGDGLATARRTVEPGGWRRLVIDLDATATGRGELSLAVPAGAALDIDAVSLRPLGDDGEPLTFRPDLLQALEDLAPSFIRFPGGCLAHGYGLANLYRWKDTVGPRHERVHDRNIWNYHQSRQIGYGEYFELCEAVGATAIPIVAAGVCCQNSPGGQRAVPDSDMDAYIQDVLDLVEYANGGIDTPWGAKRAEHGHPEPYGLRHLGVGNEDVINDDFRDRYARIENALREAHPDITVIGTTGPATSGPDYEAGWAYARERAIAVVDEHGYQSPRWLHQNLDRYGAYDPEGSKVYLGEYAGASSRIRSALAEAAYMIGLERTPGVVRLASYAPLLARVGHSQWTPDLIYFTADEVRLTASYHVQQAFGAERGEQVHAVVLEGARPFSRPVPREGAVRFRSARAAIALTEITVDGNPVPDAVITPGGDDLLLAAIDPEAAEIAFTAVRRDGADGFSLGLGPEDPQTSFRLDFAVWQNKNTAVIRRDDGIDNWESGCVWPGLADGVPVAVRVRLDGPRLQVWVDGERHHDLVRDDRPEQRVVAGALSRSGAGGGVEYVVRLVNAEDTEKPVRIDLPGTPGAVEAELSVLAGAGPDDGALFEASPVRPFRTTAKGENGIDLVLPPWSFTAAVLREASATPR
ncbi:alpha-L-arabinofuranosidase C-terminal domain-containing protein [Glycomyces harbinensis]|uniref:non-reducing end alpha-L-arabinofuranosidase n=1 Tax=Glycomyces harbinensis TaxID=58114 RepID=A0A1G6WY35_9ACTN|nr:alpha-L-arabinofuranosidase C-terminal domain-containing protein [Glycomyces harbinensis]SDD69976.1 Alpha-L-arabinofuranosidase C-terminus [Glycomyces harbinensis]